MPEHISEDGLAAIVAQEIASSLAYDRTELSRKRAQAIEYMRGEMKEWPAEAGRSSVVSRDTADTIGWILPGIIRLFTASQRMAICEPVEPGDEAWAEAATDGVNHVFWKDNDGYRLLYDGTYNSLLHGNGVIKHWWDDRPKIRMSFHSGLTDEQLTALLTPEAESIGLDGDPSTSSGQAPGSGQDPGSGQAPSPFDDSSEDSGGGDGIELIAKTTRIHKVAEIDPQTGAPVEVGLPLHDVKIKRTIRRGSVGLAAIAPEDFLINAEATSIKGARLVGQKVEKTRSDLIEMGFDRDKVERLARDSDDDEAEIARREFDPSTGSGAATSAMETVTLYELYLKLDVDGDGIAETCQIFYAGSSTGSGVGSGTILEWCVWEDEDIFSDIPCDPVPHRWDANSIFDKTKDVQEIKTVLSRQALDNLYASNNPQRFVTGRILNPDELTNPSFGGTVFGEAGASCLPLEVPFFANHAFEGIAYFDQVIEKRTGVSRTTMALDPEALQNQTATASQLAHDAAYSQTELIARNQAELGWKNVFKAILKLMVRHQDRARMIRLRGEWVEIDPRHWNADMDVTINTGIGTGSRDRDMAMLNSVLQNQIMLTQAMKQDGFVEEAIDMAPRIRATLTKIAESAGVRSPEQFYPDISADKMAGMKQMAAAAGGQPDPKMQAAMQRAEIEMKVAAMKAENELQLGRERLRAESINKRAELDAEVMLRREQIAAELQLKRELAFADAHAGPSPFDNSSGGSGAAANGVHFGGEPG